MNLYTAEISVSSPFGSDMSITERVDWVRAQRRATSRNLVGRLNSGTIWNWVSELTLIKPSVDPEQAKVPQCHS